jgi:hypothetical protein
MATFEPWQAAEQRKRSARTGMLAIGGIMLLIFGAMAAFLLWTFRVQRPAQASATATGNAEATRVADLMQLTPDAAWDWNQTETFDTNVQNWDLRPPQGEQGVTREIVDGRLLWTLASDEQVISYIYAPQYNTFSDCLLAVDATIEDGPPGLMAYGLGLRATEDGFYFFEVSGAGIWRFLIFKDEWKTLASGSSPSINTRSGNRLAIRAQGDQFTLFVNDTRVGEVVDATYTEGKAGLIVEAFEQDVRGSIAFDNLLMNCQQAEAAAQNDVTPEPDFTATAQTAATTVADPLMLTPAQPWDYDYTDNFNAPTSQWPIGVEQRFRGKVNRIYVDDRYVWLMESQEASYETHATPPYAHFEHGSVSLAAQLAEGPPEAIGYGILLRLEGDHHYLFQSTASGNWEFIRRDSGYEATVLLEGTSDAMRPGEINHLTVRTEDDWFVLFINETRLGEVQDDTYPIGRLGLMAFITDPGISGKLYFYDLHVIGVQNVE